MPNVAKDAAIHLRIPAEMLSEFQEHCYKRYMVPSQVMRGLMRSWIEAREKSEAVEAKRAAAPLTPAQIHNTPPSSDFALAPSPPVISDKLRKANEKRARKRGG
jgi:hypothetical protein